MFWFPKLARENFGREIAAQVRKAWADGGDGCGDRPAEKPRIVPAAKTDRARAQAGAVGAFFARVLRGVFSGGALSSRRFSFHGFGNARKTQRARAPCSISSPKAQN